MRTQLALKKFTFQESDRQDVTLGANVRLVPKRHRLELKEGTAGFPTSDDLFAKTRLTTPQAGRGWRVFMAVVVNKKDNLGNVLTSVGFRLSTDGVDELYWDGGSWVAANPGDWNTEAEINQGLPTFPTPKAIQVIANLKTTDPSATPELLEVRLAYDAAIEFQEDYLRSLVRKFREQVRPFSEFRVASSGGSTVDLGEVETPYNITGVDCVFDLTDDPESATDLFDSYDSNTKLVTLTGGVPSGNIISVRFLYEPEVALTTSQDYTELAKIPALVIDDVMAGDEHQLSDSCFLVDKSTGDGFVWRDAKQQDLEIPIQIITDKALDQQRFLGEIHRFFANNLFLFSIGLDEKFRLWLVEEYDQLTVPSQDELHTGRLRARIVKALFFPRAAEPVTGVVRFAVTGGNVGLEVTTQ